MVYAIERPEDAIEIFKSRVFLVKIKLGMPCGDLKFEAEETRKQGFVEILKANKGRAGKDSLPLFQVLDASGKVVVSARQCHTRLSTVLDGIQSKRMLSGGKNGSWYVPESSIDDLDRDLREKLEAERQVLLNLMSDNWDEARSQFESALSEVLDSAGISSHFDYYFSQFPSMEEIEANFSIEVLQWEPMKSLEEIIDVASSDAARKREIDVVRSQWRELKESVPKIQDDLFGQAYKVLSLAEDYDQGKRQDDYHDRAATRINEALERVAVLNDMWAAVDRESSWIKEVFEPVMPIARLVLSRKDCEDACWNLRTQWRETLSITPVGEGSKQLHGWLHPELGLESKISELTEKLAKEPDNEKLAKRLEDLKEVLRAKLGRLAAMLGDEPKEPIAPIALDDSEEPNKPDEPIAITEPADELEAVDLEQESEIEEECDRDWHAQNPEDSEPSDAPAVDPEVEEAGF